MSVINLSPTDIFENLKVWKFVKIKYISDERWWIALIYCEEYHYVYWKLYHLVAMATYLYENSYG